jgi:hypothetical protein
MASLISQENKAKSVIARLDRAIQAVCRVLDTPVKPGYDFPYHDMNDRRTRT